MYRFLHVKNAGSPTGSFVEAIPIGRPVVSIRAANGECRATLKARGVEFNGTGGSVVVALQQLAADITKAAIKQEQRGRPSDRCRLAAALLHGGPNT
jgi:hypothetical protein